MTETGRSHSSVSSTQTAVRWRRTVTTATPGQVRSRLTLRELVTCSQQVCVGLPPAITAPLSRRTSVRSMFLFTMVLECEFIKMLFVIQVGPGTASLISASINQCPRGQSEYRNFFLLISEFSFACVRCIWQCPGQSLYHQCEAGKWSDQPGQTR